ncbi:MAG: hypothetical protein U0V45_02810 [Flavobacteriales bacterium]
MVHVDLEARTGGVNALSLRWPLITVIEVQFPVEAGAQGTATQLPPDLADGLYLLTSTDPSGTVLESIPVIMGQE